MEINATNLNATNDPESLPDIRNRSFFIKWIENKEVPKGKYVCAP
jgi:hypothetical protein